MGVTSPLLLPIGQAAGSPSRCLFVRLKGRALAGAVHPLVRYGAFSNSVSLIIPAGRLQIY